MESQNTTKMVASQEKKTRMVKVQIKRDCVVNGAMVKEGQTVEVDEAVAKDLCDTRFKNVYPFSGERDAKSPDAQQGHIVRAVRV